MKHRRRWLELVIRVSALLSAVAWALSGLEFGRIGAVLLLCAASAASVRGVRPTRRPRSLTVVAYLVLAGTMAIIAVRAWPFAPIVLAVWAGVAAVPTLVWMCLHPTVRHAIAGWMGSQPASSPGDGMVPTDR